MKLKFDVDERNLWNAYWIAKQFMEECPTDHVGVYNCVVYGVGGQLNYAAYRTKAGTIVVRQCG